MSLSDETVWDAGECADYLRLSRKHFLRAVRFDEGFPVQLPWSIGRHPKWAARAVKAWALRHDYANNPEPVDS